MLIHVYHFVTRRHVQQYEPYDHGWHSRNGHFN
jgi:hypothetical protein